ncbi:hypothetical protein MNB_SV-9-283 [hydrothermal vent metagenome]|uniref:Uncharacterized protein n=1 Tax=hydrothermal vent metagenome TaxID=652676 RepID=A0A1W1CEI6_9ZZZZ
MYLNKLTAEDSLEFNSTLNLVNEAQEYAKDKVKEKTLREVKKFTPAIYMKKGNKVMAFFDTKALKNIKFLEDTSLGGVMMMIIENGQSTYTLLDKGVTYKEVSKVLMSQSKIVINQFFAKGLIYIVPPPSNVFIVTSIVGSILIEYTINKYIELDKRSYIGLEDMLWNVPDDIKNKITVLNLEDTKKETIFDFSSIDKETILDNKSDGDTILDIDKKNKESILDY